MNDGFRNGLSGLSIIRKGETLFMPLPQGSWESSGKCHCLECKGQELVKDTLAFTVPVPGTITTTFLVHMPELTKSAEIIRRDLDRTERRAH